MTDDLDLSKVMELSVVELYILNYLIRIAGSVVRFTVFNEINEELGATAISRSSFYNSLERLQERGFVEIEEGDAGRTKSVRALPLAKQAITQVNIFNLWGSIDPDQKFLSFIENNPEYFRREGRTLIVSFQYPASQLIIDKLTGDEVYLLGTLKSIGPIADGYELVSVDEGTIDKRKDFFDTSILYRYAFNQLRLEIEFSQLLEEILRVTKPGGKVILMALDQPPGSNNLILESGIGSVLNEALTTQSPQRTKQYLRDKNTEMPIQGIQEINRDNLSVIIIEV